MELHIHPDVGVCSIRYDELIRSFCSAGNTGTPPSRRRACGWTTSKSGPRTTSVSAPGCPCGSGAQSAGGGPRPDDPDRPGIIGATQVPVHGDFLANLVGFLVAGAGTAFSFIPISVAALAGVTEHESGLASGLLNTSMQIGGAIGTAIASSVAASGTNTLLRAGNPLTNALTGRFRQTFWVPGAIALIAPPRS